MGVIFLYLDPRIVQKRDIYLRVILFTFLAATIFWPLKKGIPTEEELARLADNIQQDWKRVGVALGLKEKALKAIEVDITNDVYERALAVLQKWKKKMGRKATYRKLAAAFNDQLVQRPALVKTFSSDNPG